MSGATLVPLGLLLISRTGLLPSSVCLSRQLLLSDSCFVSGPQPHTEVWFGLFPFRSPLLRESMFLSLPPATYMFQFTGLPPVKLWIHFTVRAHYRTRVSPFGYLRVAGCLHLTAAFRSLPRPSSAPIAKASALCSLFLNLLFEILLKSSSFFVKRH